jgi:hypothetical protein
MDNIRTYDDLILEWPELGTVADLDKRQAIFLAFKVGRLIGGLTEMNRQAVRREIELAGDLPVIAELTGTA